jgi:lipopolysaccharide export system protein LptC
MSSPTEAPRSGIAVRANRALRFAALARWMSWAAGAIGIGIVALFLVQAGFFAALVPDDKVEPEFTGDPDEATASDSTLTGLDKQNLPYQVRAKRGWQDKDKPNIVHMESIDATFGKADGKTYLMVSNTGIYDTKTKELDLEGAIAISEGSRFTARMEKAHMVVDSKELTSNVPVDVEMAGGTIRANGLQITNDGAKILFLNGVKARFGAEAQKGDQVP